MGCCAACRAKKRQYSCCTSKKIAHKKGTLPFISSGDRMQGQGMRQGMRQGGIKGNVPFMLKIHLAITYDITYAQ